MPRSLTSEAPQTYSDALFNNHLIGPFSSQGLDDPNHTLVPTLHNFTYDVYFSGATWVFRKPRSLTSTSSSTTWDYVWGHECRVAGGNEWDIWDPERPMDSHRGCLPSQQQFLEPPHHSGAAHFQQPVTL